MNVPVITRMRTSILLLSCLPKRQYNRIQQKYGSHCGKFPYTTSFALESEQSINTPCLPDGPTGRLCPFSRFVLLPGGRWALWAGFPRGALPMTVFPRGDFTLPPLPPTILGMVDITRKVPRMGNMPYGVGSRFFWNKRVGSTILPE